MFPEDAAPRPDDVEAHNDSVYSDVIIPFLLRIENEEITETNTRFFLGISEAMTIESVTLN